MPDTAAKDAFPDQGRSDGAGGMDGGSRSVTDLAGPDGPRDVGGEGVRALRHLARNVLRMAPALRGRRCRGPRSPVTTTTFLAAAGRPHHGDDHLPHAGRAPWLG